MEKRGMFQSIHELDIHGAFTPDEKTFFVRDPTGQEHVVALAAKNRFLNFLGWLIGSQVRLRVFDEQGKQQDVFVVADSARKLLRSAGVRATAGLGRSLAILLAGFSSKPDASVSLSRITSDRYYRKEEKSPEHPIPPVASKDIQAIQVDPESRVRLQKKFGLSWPTDAKFLSSISERDKDEFWEKFLEVNVEKTLEIPRDATLEEAAFIGEFIERRTLAKKMIQPEDTPRTENPVGLYPQEPDAFVEVTKAEGIAPQGINEFHLPPNMIVDSTNVTANNQADDDLYTNHLLPFRLDNFDEKFAPLKRPVGYAAGISSLSAAYNMYTFMLHVYIENRDLFEQGIPEHTYVSSEGFSMDTYTNFWNMLTEIHKTNL